MTSPVFQDGDLGPDIRRKLNEMGVAFDAAKAGLSSLRGWSAVLALVSDGERRVFKIVDWVGGEKEKPTNLGYVGSTGIVATAALALDVRGDQGAQGIQGMKGDQGDQGIQGMKGDQGIQGIQGMKGDQGDQGIQGIQGVKGDQGIQGIQGIQGMKGDQGDQGIQGVKGDQGGTGPVNTLTIGTVTSGAAAATITGTSPSQTLNLTIPKGDTGASGAVGNAGWTPVFANTVDGSRIVQQVIDWVGGEGSKPPTGNYVGASGLVTLITDGVNIRGASGAGSGDVTGSASSVTGNIAVFADGTGKTLADGGKLGSAAYTDSPYFATATQGAKADSAVQPSDLAPVATSGSYADLTGTPSIPAAQVQADWNATSGLAQILNKPVIASAGVSSFNGLTGDVVYEVVQLTAPSNVTPATSTIYVKPEDVLVANISLSLYGSAVESRFQISTSADFSTGLYSTAWVTSGTPQVSYTLTASEIDEGALLYYWRLQCRTTVSEVTHTSSSTAFTFTTETSFLNTNNADSLNSLITIQADYNPATTYSAGAIVIVRKSARRFIEYKSLVESNVGNNPETSPATWELIFDNNTATSGYLGEILGSDCVVDKGEWLSTATYSIGDMVVVKNIPAPKKQSDLTAYVAKTANTNKAPASNPSDWEQRNALPTGTSLADNLGLSATGAVLQNNDSGWLKFVHQGKVKYIAKKSFMHSVSWNDIAKAEAVYGNRTIRIGSNLFRVSILSGAEADPSSWVTASTATANKGAGSEWNQLIYRVCSVIPTDGATTYHGGKQIGSNWKDFTEADLNITGNGGYAWCKETLGYNTSSRVDRGGSSLSYFNGGTSSGAGTAFGWRPCLTLISEPEADSKLYNAEASGVGPSVASLQYDPITDTGFYGETTTADLYTGSQISAATAVTAAGTLQFDTDPWLKFYWHGQVLYIAKKPYRHTVSWNNINTANAVYGVNLGSTGRTRLTKGSIQLDVKLLKGATKDPSPAGSPGRQWNELIYRVAVEVPAGQVGDNWGTYTSADLQITGNGSYCWMQEVYQPSVSSRVFRGDSLVSDFNRTTSSYADTSYGWRPCLALVR